MGAIGMSYVIILMLDPNGTLSIRSSTLLSRWCDSVCIIKDSVSGVSEKVYGKTAITITVVFNFYVIYCTIFSLEYKFSCKQC